MLEETKPKNYNFLKIVLPALAITVAIAYALSPNKVLKQKHGETIKEHSTSVDLLPGFPGGQRAWADFVRGYEFPPEAIKNKVSGRVIVQFAVEADGRLTDIKVVRDLGMGTGDAAVRLLKRSPKWEPGIQNGKPVRVAYTQPINLSLQ